MIGNSLLMGAGSILLIALGAYDELSLAFGASGACAPRSPCDGDAEDMANPTWQKSEGQVPH